MPCDSPNASPPVEPRFHADLSGPSSCREYMSRIRACMSNACTVRMPAMDSDSVCPAAA